ncbi:hypothetical protein [Sphingomonas sp. LR55]|jgi:hypothetical protein|uniref:hypothetical protein n=1 Tax=Sphingomonas sp. LR55 TaxID=3050231 RepID=UPI002FE170B1
MAQMLFPPDFNLIDLEAARRHHIMLATLAVTVPVMEFHMNLAQFYEERVIALSQAAGRPAHHGEPSLKLVVG